MLEIPRASIHRILRCNLKKKTPHHIQVFHSLQENYPRRAAKCSEIIDETESASLINKVLFSDDATFRTRGKLNRHNCCVWADKKPPNFLEWEGNTPKVSIWFGMSRPKVYGPFLFAETTVRGPAFLDMLEQFLEPRLLADGIPDTVGFQQD